MSLFYDIYLKKRKTTGYYEREARKREMSQFKKVLSTNNW